nr:MAG TPA: hypothetical protein [Microviridae sp.]
MENEVTFLYFINNQNNIIMGKKRRYINIIAYFAYGK